ncbi:tRNA adenosine deaminase-associated protein [Nocardioides dubius]|uniref:tRNA adenosine deaminase-associated protein n=1 Tax=Nocardioides dubius TaxID=317019 RepID=A0ABN1TVE3_9ACTN
MVGLTSVEFALAAFHRDGEWQVEQLTESVLVDVETLAAGLHRFPADGGALALIGLDEDAFLVVRTSVAQTRLLLSDITTADEWELARTAVEHLGLPFPEDDDEEAPAGDLTLLSDLGVDADTLAQLVDEDRYADEVLSEVAALLGFGAAFDRAVGLTSS